MGEVFYEICAWREEDDPFEETAMTMEEAVQVALRLSEKIDGGPVEVVEVGPSSARRELMAWICSRPREEQLVRTTHRYVGYLAESERFERDERGWQQTLSAVHEQLGTLARAAVRRQQAWALQYCGDFKKR